MPLRFDTGTVKNVERRDDGSIVADAVVTRTGVFVYRNADGSTRRELRHPDHVFKLDSLSSMKMIPVTNNHPTDFVNPENVQKLKVGNTGENIRPDGHTIKASLVVDAKDGIKAIDAGRRQLSLGYSVDLVREDGTYRGERYDHVQTNIKYNHLALVDIARAGSVASLHLDAADAVEIENPVSTNNPNKRSKAMPQLVIDSAAYEVDEGVITGYNAQKNRADKAEGELETTKTDLSKVTAERDDAAEKLKAEQKKDHSEEINKRVDARVKLLKVADKALDDEAKKNLDGMNDDEIRRAVIVARSANKEDCAKALEGKDETYIVARFDAAIENLDAEPQKRDDGVSGQRKASTPRQDGSQNNDDGEADKARKDMVDRMTNPELFDENGKRKS